MIHLNQFANSARNAVEEERVGWNVEPNEPILWTDSIVSSQLVSLEVCRRSIHRAQRWVTDYLLGLFMTTRDLIEFWRETIVKKLMREHERINQARLNSSVWTSTGVKTIKSPQFNMKITFVTCLVFTGNWIIKHLTCETWRTNMKQWLCPIL